MGKVEAKSFNPMYHIYILHPMLPYLSSKTLTFYVQDPVQHRIG